MDLLLMIAPETPLALTVLFGMYEDQRVMQIVISLFLVL
jgi:hypothetical protein